MFGSCPTPSSQRLHCLRWSDAQTNQLHNFKMFTQCTWCNIGITLRRSKRTIVFSDVPTQWSRMLVVNITFAQLVRNFHCVLWKPKFHHAARESMPQTPSWTTWISFTSLSISMRFILITSHHGWLDSVVCLATHYGMGGQEFETRSGKIFPFLHTGPRSKPVSSAIGTGFFLRGEGAGREINPPYPT
jgi:hypothetical protein